MLVTTLITNSEPFNFMKLVKDINHTNIFHFTTWSGHRQTAAEVGKTTRQQSSDSSVFVISFRALIGQLRPLVGF